MGKDLWGFARLYGKDSQDLGKGFVEICETLGKDLEGFVEICETLGKGFGGICETLGKDL